MLKNLTFKYWRYKIMYVWKEKWNENMRIILMYQNHQLWEHWSYVEKIQFLIYIWQPNESDYWLKVQLIILCVCLMPGTDSTVSRSEAQGGSYLLGQASGCMQTNSLPRTVPDQTDLEMGAGAMAFILFHYSFPLVILRTLLVQHMAAAILTNRR